MGKPSVGWEGEWWQKVCPGCISETVMCRKLIPGRDMVRGCRCNVML